MNDEWLTRGMQDWLITNATLVRNEIKIGHRRMAQADVEKKGSSYRLGEDKRVIPHVKIR